MWRGGLSYRRLDVLIRNLPEDSRTQTVLRDLPRPAPVEDGPRKFGPWSLGDYLLAHLINAVNRNTYAVAVAGQLKNPQPPEPFPMPGVSAKPERRNPEAVVLYLDRMRAKG